MITAKPWVYLFGALLVLTLPLSWLTAAVCAAVIHELCHILALKATGGQVRQIQVGIGGAVIESQIGSNGRELLCALAGPAGSFLLALLYSRFPRLALCGAVQGLFNLLPVYPMDGGRILACVIAMWLPGREEKVLEIVQTITCVTLLIFAFVGSFVFSLGIGPILVTILLILKVFLRKRPCKRSQIRVQ